MTHRQDQKALTRIVSLLKTGPAAIALRISDQLLRLASGAPVQRLSRVTPHLYVGGQHRKRGWPAMQKQGITAIVNMREAQHDDRTKAAAPARYLHLATTDNTPPSLEDLQKGVEFIAEEIAQGGAVYIHCGVGVGRAPTMAAAYLIATGMSADDALNTIKQARPFIHPTPGQKAQLEHFARENAKKFNEPQLKHKEQG